MGLHNCLQVRTLEIGTGAGTETQQYISNVIAELVPVARPTVIKLMPAQEKSFRSRGSNQMIDPGQPLWHAVVVRVFGFECERFVKLRSPGQDWNRPMQHATICRNSA